MVQWNLNTNVSVTMGMVSVFSNCLHLYIVVLFSPVCSEWIPVGKKGCCILFSISSPSYLNQNVQTAFLTRRDNTPFLGSDNSFKNIKPPWFNSTMWFQVYRPELSRRLFCNGGSTGNMFPYVLSGNQMSTTQSQWRILFDYLRLRMRFNLNANCDYLFCGKYLIKKRKT